MARLITTPLFVAALLLLAFLSPCAVAKRAPRWSELTPDYTYEEYVTQFGKQRQRAHDFGARKVTFETELLSILQHNADPTKTYKRGINKFSDWTAAEKRAMLMQMGSAAQGMRDGNTTIAPPPQPTTTQAPRRRHNERLNFDWRDVTPPVLTTVKDQGLCGSCWAHGTTEAIESQVALNTGLLYVLSQQQLISCVPNVTVQLGVNDTDVMGGCRGYFPNIAMDYIMGPPFNGGFAQEWENPYRDFWGITNYSTPAHEKCELWMSEIPRPLATLKGYDFIPFNNGEAMQNAVINRGPVIVVMAVYDDLISYETGVYASDMCEGKNGSMPPSHIVNIVGFGYDKAANTDYWSLRNSWSPYWGEGGYFRVARPSVEPCGVMSLPVNISDPTQGTWTNQAACGMCGILSRGILPIAE